MLDSYLTFYQSTCQATRLPTYLCTMYLNDATIQHRFVPEVTPSCTRFTCMICPDVRLGKITNWKQAQPNCSKAGKVRNEGSNGCNPKLHWHYCFCQLRQSMAESHFRTRRVIISARKSPEFSPFQESQNIWFDAEYKIKETCSNPLASHSIHHYSFSIIFTCYHAREMV